MNGSIDFKIALNPPDTPESQNKKVDMFHEQAIQCDIQSAEIHNENLVKLTGLE